METAAKVLIIIPAYNEEAALPRTVASLQNLPDGYEAVIINDGSTDRTAGIAAELARGSRVRVRVLNLPVNSGIGVAMQTGFRFAARGGAYDYAVQFDGDGQHDAAYIPALVETCVRDGLDLCIGSRFLDDDDASFRSTLPRRAGIRFLAGLISALSGTRVTDPTSGFRCAGRRALQRFAQHYPEDYPEPESLFWCARNKLRIGEIPVRMHARQGGVSSITAVGGAYYMIKVSLAILIDRVRVRELMERSP